MGALPLAGAAACHAAPPAPPPPAPNPAPVAPAPDTVWTAAPGVVLRVDADSVVVSLPLTRLEVLASDSAGLRVRCAICADTRAGVVDTAAVIHRPALPETAAAGTLAEFALAVRHAAARRDLEALRSVMAPDFSFSMIGGHGRDNALEHWRWEDFRTLDRVPALLDSGLSPLHDFWVAPLEYASVLQFTGLRLGFRRTPAGRWEWVFLMRGEMG